MSFFLLSFFLALTLALTLALASEPRDEGLAGLFFFGQVLGRADRNCGEWIALFLFSGLNLGQVLGGDDRNFLFFLFFSSFIFFTLFHSFFFFPFLFRILFLFRIFRGRSLALPYLSSPLLSSDLTLSKRLNISMSIHMSSCRCWK